MRFRWILVGLIAAGCSAVGAVSFADEPAAVAPGRVPEPARFHDGAMHGYTPNTITGGTVLDTAQMAKLVASAHPVLLDVAEKDRKPPSMDKDMIWLPNHRSLPGAIFLQDGGRGDVGGGYAAAFKARVAALTHGDKATPIVTFCHPDCWGSWNAAKRLLEDGYTKVYWYPEGTEGWQADHDTMVVQPDADWVNSLSKEATQ